MVVHSRKLQYIILGIFDKKQHNRQYIRLCYKYLPGHNFGEIIRLTSNQIIAFGKLYIVQYLIEREISQNINLKILHHAGLFRSKIFTSKNADFAAAYGYLHIVKYLHSQGIKCTYNGANVAAMNGHLSVVQYLHSQNIKCTFAGAELAYRCGKLDMVKYLRSQGLI